MKARHLLILSLAVVGCEAEAAANALPDPQHNVTELPTVEASRGPAASYQSFYVGTLEARETVRVASAGSGTLAKVAFREGDTVRKGDVLFRLSGTSTKLGLSRARKQLDIARQQAKTAERELARARKLHASGAGTQASLDQAESTFDAATLQVEQAKVNVSLSRSGVGDLVMRAPIDAVVTARLKEPGEAVTSTPPSVVMELQDRSSLEARFEVPEVQLADFPEGTKLRAFVPALQSHRELEVLRSGIEVNPATRTIEIISRVDNADGKLKPGMSFEAQRPTEETLAMVEREDDGAVR